MLHLSAERLAALADAGTAPDVHEHEHLSLCRECVAEREVYAALLHGASLERSAIAAPLTSWDAIAAGLRAEGLIDGAHTGAAHAVSPARRSGGGGGVTLVGRGIAFPRSRTVRAAAAVALLAAGVAAGRASAVAGPLAVAAPMPAATVAEAGNTFGAPAVWPANEQAAEYRSVSEAEAALQRIEVAYQHAAAYLAASDSATRVDATEDYRTRLVALDRAGRTMREAMEQAPYDPVLAGYYLTTLGEREATLRQLNVAVPVGARLNSF